MLHELSEAGVEGSIRGVARKAGTKAWKALKPGLRNSFSISVGAVPAMLFQALPE